MPGSVITDAGIVRAMHPYPWREFQQRPAASLLARAPHPLAAGEKMIARKESSKEKRGSGKEKEKEKTRHWMKMGGVEDVEKDLDQP